MKQDRQDTIVLVVGDDWQGLYRNGALLMEGHSVSAYEALVALGMSPRRVEPDQEWLEREGGLPTALSLVKRA